LTKRGFPPECNKSPGNVNFRPVNFVTKTEAPAANSG
jgi:hypothetical protein